MAQLVLQQVHALELARAEGVDLQVREAANQDAQTQPLMPKTEMIAMAASKALLLQLHMLLQSWTKTMKMRRVTA